MLEEKITPQEIDETLLQLKKVLHYRPRARLSVRVLQIITLLLSVVCLVVSFLFLRHEEYKNEDIEHDYANFEIFGILSLTLFMLYCFLIQKGKY